MGVSASSCVVGRPPQGVDIRGLEQLLEAERKLRGAPGPSRGWRADEHPPSSRAAHEPLSVDDVERELVLPVTLPRRCAYVDAANQLRVGAASLLLIADDRLPLELVVRAAAGSVQSGPTFFWLRALSEPACVAPPAPAHGELQRARTLSRAILVIDLAQPTSERAMRAYARLLALAASCSLELGIVVAHADDAPLAAQLVFSQAPCAGQPEACPAQASEEADFFSPRTLHALSGWLGALGSLGERERAAGGGRLSAGSAARARADPDAASAELAVQYVCEYLAREGGAALSGGYWPDLPLCACLAQLLIAHSAAARAHELVDATLCACEGLLQRVRLESAAELAQVRAELARRGPDPHARADECGLSSAASRAYARQLCEPTAAIARLLARAAEMHGDPCGVVAAHTRELRVCRLALGERHELSLRAQLSLAAALLATGDARVAEILAGQVCHACGGQGGGTLGPSAEAAPDALKQSEAPTRHASSHPSYSVLSLQPPPPAQQAAHGRPAGAAGGGAHAAVEPADPSKPAGPVRAVLALEARKMLASALRAQGRLDEAQAAESER